MESITKIIDGVIEREGGYINHLSDPGGATMYGVTERVARASGYRGPMRELPRSTAYAIYYRQYVAAPKFDDVAAIDAAVAEELIDTGVNAGTGRAATWLQEALNALNCRGRDYPNIAEDGIVGRGTLAALKAYKARRGRAATATLLKALDVLQGGHYLRLADNDSKFEDFANGWFAHRIGNVAA